MKTRLVLSFSIGKHAFVESEIVKLIIIPQNSNQPLNHQTGPSLSTRMTMTRLARLKSTDNGIFPLLIDGHVFPLNWLYCLKHFVSTHRCNSGLVVFLLQSAIYNYCWGLCSPKRILTQKGFRFRPDAFTQLYIDSIYAERCTERQIKIYFFSFSNREFLENLRHSPNLFFYKSAFVAPNWDRSAVEVIFWLERKTNVS